MLKLISHLNIKMKIALLNQEKSPIQIKVSKQIYQINSLCELHSNFISSNQIAYTIINASSPISKNFINQIKQFKLFYPHIKTILIAQKISLEEVIWLNKAGVDYTIANSNKLNICLSKIITEETRRTEAIIEIKDLKIDLTNQKVIRSNKQINLRRHEYMLLEYLARQPNQLHTYTDLLEKIWGYRYNSFSNTLNVHMSSLRKKLDRGHKQKLIKTVYSQGYKLETN